MTLELFIMEGCPWCRRVINWIDQSGRRDIACVDIDQSPEAERRLIAVGGKRQVPCLFIDGKPMYESQDIIEWLKAHPAAE